MSNQQLQWMGYCPPMSLSLSPNAYIRIECSPFIEQTMIDTYIKKIASITKRGDAGEESYYPAFAKQPCSK
jgi:hypothetical protein